MYEYLADFKDSKRDSYSTNSINKCKDTLYSTWVWIEAARKELPNHLLPGSKNKKSVERARTLSS